MAAVLSESPTEPKVEAEAPARARRHSHASELTAVTVELSDQNGHSEADQSHSHAQQQHCHPEQQHHQAEQQHCQAVHSAADRKHCDSTVEEVGHKEARAILSLDNLGIAASSLCLVHCLAMPFLMASLPFLGLQFLEGNFAHRLLAGFVIAFALFAVLPGYLKHRRKPVLVAMVIGLTLVLFATFGIGHHEQWELPLISIGNLILVGTHLRNRGLLKCDHVH